jgi:hypothetical protein
MKRVDCFNSVLAYIFFLSILYLLVDDRDS